MKKPVFFARHNLSKKNNGCSGSLTAVKTIIIIIISIGLGVVFIIDSGGIRQAVSESVQLCLNTIIPSLFAFLALSSFIMSTGLIRGQTAVFLLSVTGGYPVGIKLLTEFSESADSAQKRKQAENMMMYCFCGSPAYIAAITDFGIYVWLSNVIACLIFAVIVNIFTVFFRNKPEKSADIYTCSDSRRMNLTSRSFIESVVSAGTALYKICLMIVMFSVIIRVLEFTGIISQKNNVLSAFLEVTNTINLSAEPAVIAALTSFGGLCVIFQIIAINGGRINLRKFLLARIPVAALSAGICQIMMVITAKNTATETLAEQAIQPVQPRILISAAGNPIASVCLLIMTLILAKTLSYSHPNGLTRFPLSEPSSTENR